MTVAQDYTTLSSNGYLTVVWLPTNGMANYQSPTATELNAGLNLSKAISWSDFSFNMSASNTTNDPSLADLANTKDRGSAQYGGNMSFYQPGAATLSSDTYKLAKAAIGIPRTTGYVIVRLDGAKPNTQAFAAGDLVSVFLVQTDAQTNVITGEEAFRYTVAFLQQGALSHNTVVRSTTATVAVTPSTQTISSSSPHARLKATVLGREYTNGVVWTSSDSTKVTVSGAGVLTWVASGSATITATFAATGASATCAVTAS